MNSREMMQEAAVTRGRRWRAIPLVPLCALLACGHGDQSSGAPTAPTQTTTYTPPPVPTWDVTTQGIPKFISVNYIDLTQLDSARQPLVNYISMFRSSYGHAYGDRDETCMSKKHYFGFPDSATKIYVPVSGTVVNQNYGPSLPYVTDRFAIQPDGYPAFTVTIFHAVLSRVYLMGDRVTAGQLLGHHVGSGTSSDIAIAVEDGGPTPATTYVVAAKRLVSYFDVLNDSVFAQYQARGIKSRADLQLTKEQRAAWPLTCKLGTDFFDPFGGWFPDKLTQLVKF